MLDDGEDDDATKEVLKPAAVVSALPAVAAVASASGLNDILEEFTCPICIDCPDTAEEVASISGCCHRFCFDCIDRWARTENRCPLCKARFNTIDRVVQAATPVAASSETTTAKKRKRNAGASSGRSTRARRGEAGTSPAGAASARVNSRTVEDRNQPSISTHILTEAMLERILQLGNLGVIRGDTDGSEISFSNEGGRSSIRIRSPQGGGIFGIIEIMLGGPDDDDDAAAVGGRPGQRVTFTRVMSRESPSPDSSEATAPIPHGPFGAGASFRERDAARRSRRDSLAEQRAARHRALAERTAMLNETRNESAEQRAARHRALAERTAINETAHLTRNESSSRSNSGPGGARAGLLRSSVDAFFGVFASSERRNSRSEGLTRTRPVPGAPERRVIRSVPHGNDVDEPPSVVQPPRSRRVRRGEGLNVRSLEGGSPSNGRGRGTSAGRNRRRPRNGNGSTPDQPVDLSHE